MFHPQQRDAGKEERRRDCIEGLSRGQVHASCFSDLISLNPPKPPWGKALLLPLCNRGNGNPPLSVLPKGTESEYGKSVIQL